MTNFKISNTGESEKIFLINSSEIDGRLDPIFYFPSLVQLEKEVNKTSPIKLRKYVEDIASGATPKTTESEKYYSTEDPEKAFDRAMKKTI